MKIRGWSIDGFGRLSDFSVSGLPDGLTVLHGANEAGKSTLLEFLRCVLFGGPDGVDALPYAPLNGARHRGRVLVSSADGELVIERDFGNAGTPTLRRPDGRAVDAAELHRLLGGADDRLFRSVFAFSIDDLRSLAALDAGGVREALFSAAVAGAGRSARAAAQALRAQASARFDGEGTAQINRLIAELDALRPRLGAARRAALAYPEQCAATERLADAIEARRDALAQRRAARVRDDALLHVWPAWEELQAARAELAAIEPVEAPPPDAEANLGRARERLGGALSAAQALRLEQGAVEQRVAALPPDAVSVAAAAEIEALHADLPLHRFQLAALATARQRGAETAQLLAERLLRAGPDWTAERLRGWVRNGVDRDSVRDWQTRMRAGAERARQARWRLDDASAAREAARRERQRAAAELPTTRDADDVERHRQALAALRAGLDEMLARRSDGEVVVQTLHTSEGALRALEAEQDPPMTVWLAMALEATTVATGAVLVWAVTQSMMQLGLAALALVALAGTASRWARERQREQARREDERRAAQRALRGEIEAARRKRDADMQRAAQLAEEVAVQATALGLPSSPSGAELDGRERALAEEVAAAARADRARARLAELDHMLRQREEEEQARLAEVAAIATARQAEEAEWVAWSAAAGLAGEATPDAALARVAQLEAAQTGLAAAETAERELRQVEPIVSAWEARARAALGLGGAADGDPHGPEALIERVVALRARVQDETPRRLRRFALLDEMRERAARLAVAESEAVACQAEREATLRAAGVRDEAELVQRRALVERRAALQRTVAERERMVGERLADPGALAELAQGSVEAWRQRTRQADEEVAGLEQEIYQLVAELHDLRAACRAREESAEVAELEAEWSALMAELGEAVREWRVLAAAEGLIEEARRAFERTRQPAVLRAASVAFGAVTGGFYERIAQDEEGAELLVIERDGRRKQVCSELSRGTTEQLYLALRLGLAQELGRLGVALPLVMDDVLVNFDPERALAMAAVLGTFARQQQVLFFTCHPSTRDLLLQHGAASRVVEL